MVSIVCNKLSVALYIVLLVLHCMKTIITLFEKATALPQRLVDSIGMYRVVTLALVSLVIFSFISGAIGWLTYGPGTQAVSLAVALVVALGLNYVLAALYRVAANHESAVITALIMFFLVIPTDSLVDNWQLAGGTSLAIVSKYLIAYRWQHIANPAATGAVLLALGIVLYNLVAGTDYTTDIFSWWIANPTLLWPVVIVGSLVVFKVRKWPMILTFFAVGLLVFLFEEWSFGVLGIDSVSLYFVQFPTLFLAFFMLTEPFTMPPTTRTQMAYAALVGFLSSTTLFSPFFAMTPELALVFGNVFAYSYRIRQKLYLELLEKRQIAVDTWEFVFNKPTGFTFAAGQYLEWMLPHAGADSRGVRRYFTIASSPTENVVRLALRMMPEGKRGSSYKRALAELDTGDVVIASQLSGDFLLPSDTSTKLGFIAGGIGITPFSSHLRYMADSGKAHDTALYYACNEREDLAYVSDFAQLDLPLSIVPVLNDGDESAGEESGYITPETLTSRTPDYRERTWYISGPPGMVNAYNTMLQTAAVPRQQIKKDFFPGLA